ncbi:type VI secretion system membrane subunit TssM [Limnobacter parvus]|uniref:Type VI secretion system membrane subunit TssM n=1 Tax=Limnobacter parvus TaxID=2939690 RepID=A0ABT1XJY5_9BURK|nr:type VI secretion system membrane subunit TssM [Limnobacter parvus]MCR2747166.1 type VI secretion system membrane subunit TssM [Limnobacter parvus]
MLLRFVLSLLAFLGFLALIWLVGPIVSIGESRPFSSLWVQVLLSIVIFLLVFGPLAWRWWKVRKAEHALKAGLTRQDEQSRVQSAKLQDIFNEAVGTLKQHQARKAWYQSKPGLYELPWYVIIGPPGSGKTTALKNAGLRFPLQDPMGKDAIKGVGGTRNCDWWFTDQAVLIDTAGRFTTQDSDQNTDAAGWNSFLRLLKKHRPKQPVNGVLLTLSIQELLDTESRRKETAAKIALRLQEMIRALGMCPPVYVLITKLDLLNGFKETFGRLSEAERAQAWGVNFEHPNTLNTTLTNTLPSALGAMVDRLSEQLNTRLMREEQENRRIKLFEFPLALAQLKPAIESILSQAFQSESPFEKPVVLRGLYLSSGTQDGTVFDRIASAMAPNAGIDSAVKGQGKSFFIRDVLSQVVFAEQHLASYVKKKALLEQGLYVGVLSFVCVLFGLLSLGWWISHGNNSNSIAQTLERTERLAAKAATLPTEAQAPLQELFQTLDELREVAQNSPDKLGHQLGLNQDEKLAQAEQFAYRNALNTALMPRVAKRLEDRLRAALNQDMELAYESLKAYVMIHTPAQFDAESLTTWVVFDWQQNVLSGYEPDLRESASQHLQAAIALGAPLQLPPKDAELIENARQIIGAQALDERLYKRMVRFFKPDANSDFNLVKTVGVSAAGIFTRSSGQSLNQGVDALYTRNTYVSYFLVQLPVQAKQLSDEASWVLGEGKGEGNSNSMNAANTPGLMRRARELYIRDYIQVWDNYLKDVQIQRPAQFEQAVDLSRVLASPQSPLKKFLEGVSENTRLAGSLGKNSDKAEAVANQKANQALSPNVALLAGSDFKPVDFVAPLEQQVDEHFSNINGLFEGNPPAYSQVSTLLNDLYAQLAAIASAKKSKSAPPPPAAMDEVQVNAGVLPEPVRAIVGQLAGQGSAQGRAAERANLSADLRPLQDVCRRTVSNRYPIHSGSGLDVLSDDFARFFGPGGLMDQFFASRLASVVDTGSADWKLKPLSDGSQAPANPAIIQFQRAARIRDVFFPGNTPNAAFNVEMRLLNSSNPSDVFYMETNGDLKMFSKQFQPNHRIQWGGQSPSSTLRIRASEGAYKTYNGPWALFRLFDSAQIQNTERPEKFKAIFTLEGKQFEFEVMANSAFNPLRLNELRQFRCPGNL